MELRDALEALPQAYSSALRLRLAGAGEAAIAAELGLEVEAVHTLLTLAHEKLNGLLAEPNS